jgi:predicted dehydrogenase
MAIARGLPARRAATARRAAPRSGADAESPVKIGVIGCGYWGPQLIRNFSELSEAQLVGVADRRPARLDYVRSRYDRVLAVPDHETLLASDIDAVVVATPIHTHYALAKEAILAGKHVLVEKPLAASVEEALDLVSLAAERGLTLMVGHTFLYNPAVTELRRMVRSRELGRVFYVDAARLNLGLFHPLVNVMWDLAPHDISILTDVLGEAPVAVSARGSCCVRPGVHDVAYLSLTFPSGVGAQIHVSWLDPAKVRRITVVGDEKMVVYNDVSLGEKIRVYDKGVTTPVTDSFGEFQLSYRYGAITIPYIEWQEPLRLECADFLASISSGQRPVADGHEGLVVVAVLESAERSLRNGGREEPVEIPEDPTAQTLRLRIDRHVAGEDLNPEEPLVASA